MSVATIAYPGLAAARTNRSRQVVDIEAWLSSMRRVYTFTEYVPRHRADGPAL
ncbi:hypothetical protein ISU07_05755 [Nocardioides islandensis]|jgi:hypothetical protein|uniref:Uncharacterized protein n=1 Tax=Nocardioides islandensis TaxID=433663 RepID=A0A930V831_9ACTN|nr:hypothetical protein [Nocardioides islandensis]MBF4762624.1 hypothetical protein [Nocardioides islandensis]